MHHSKGHSHSSYSSQQQQQQQHYSHHQPTGGQYWTSYNNPRRSGPGHYSRGGYAGGNNEQHWTQKGNRYPSHRLMNNATSNYPAANQQSPPSQRRPTEHDYYKSERERETHTLTLELFIRFRKSWQWLRWTATAEFSGLFF